MTDSDVSPVKDRAEMLRQMSPMMEPGCYVFRRAKDETDLVRSLPMAIAMFREAEGVSLIVPSASDAPMAMRWISLRVHSALDGVGLTAAVSEALAESGIPCNMVAALAHDHVFVPVDYGEMAVDILKALSARS